MSREAPVTSAVFPESVADEELEFVWRRRKRLCRLASMPRGHELIMELRHRERLDDVQRAVQPQIDAVARHPVFQQLTSITALRTFMQHHVYAVWDFMSLLKALQRAVTCIEIPWVPCGDPAARRFINEIVRDEESDQVSLDGDPPAAMSHFELYLRAMERVGA